MVGKRELKMQFPSQSMLEEEQTYQQETEMISLNIILPQRIVQEIEGIVDNGSRMGFDGTLSYLIEEGIAFGDLSSLYEH